MRVTTGFLIAAIAACHPSATIENTTPVANLQSYRTVALRVHSASFALWGRVLEANVLQRLRAQCGFEQIGRPGATPADVTLDLNITSMGRGGTGWVRNANLATMETLLVLTDGQNGELLGTARIHGQSSGMLVANARPENEAIDVVAKTVADQLAKSGCTGPRVARVEPPAKPPEPPPGDGSAATPPDESHRTEAEALNDQGKEKLQNADMPGALVSFQQAVALVPDARYEFNACLALEAQEQWDSAIAACRKARGMNPDARLVTKIDHRIDLLQHHH